MIKELGKIEIGKRWGRGYKRATFTVSFDTDWDMYELTNVADGRKSHIVNKFYGYSLAEVVEMVSEGLKVDGVVYTKVITVEETTTEETTTEETTTEEVIEVKKTVELGYMGSTQYEFWKNGLHYLYISSIRGFRRYIEDKDLYVQDVNWFECANDFYAQLAKDTGKGVV